MTTIKIQADVKSKECRDWVHMLANMYYFWATQNGYSAFISKSESLKAEVQTDAPIDLMNEGGIYRLVRVSPYDPEQRRHSVYARVCVNGIADCDFIPRRSFVLDPYQLVKDHRMEIDHNNPYDVLSGKLEILWPGVISRDE